MLARRALSTERSRAISAFAIANAVSKTMHTLAHPSAVQIAQSTTVSPYPEAVSHTSNLFYHPDCKL